MKTYKMNDKTIAQIAKCVQIAILTGTDIVDNLRQLEFRINRKESEVTVTDEYLQAFESNVEKMLSELNTADNETTSTEKSLTDSPDNYSEDEDDLEIPAFLRRQKN